MELQRLIDWDVRSYKWSSVDACYNIKSRVMVKLFGKIVVSLLLLFEYSFLLKRGRSQGPKRNSLIC
jgi:hypothetical protein